jgi:hypothetical protein
MHDPVDFRSADLTSVPSTRARAEAEPQAMDREVPLDARELPNAVHAWLDGDQVPSASLAAAEREVALWKRIGAETGRRSRMVTPAHVPAQILAKLADD